MTREEMKSHLQSLLGYASPENQANASEILTSISEGYESLLSASEASENRVKELTENNETLRAVNAKLFLKVGATEKEIHGGAPETNEPKDDLDGLTFEKLFDEKGDLI